MFVMSVLTRWMLLLFTFLIQPRAFRIFNPQDETTWKAMSAIKSNILRRMDTAPAAVRVCCIKFAQRVVQAQTPGAISDPRVRAIVASLCCAFGQLTPCSAS